MTVKPGSARQHGLDDAPYVIDVEGLTKSFSGRTVVRDVSLRVRRGSIYGFVGPNGSGKTTTIRMLCGLLTPDSGRGTCLGYDILRQSLLIKARVAYMTQRFSLYQDLSVRENFEFVARIYGLSDPAAAARSALERLDLGPRAEMLTGHLSGGWKQRVALAACVLPGPELLLLDEPTAGVDPRARREFWSEIHDLAGQGLTVLVTTHYMDEAERCHEIAYMGDGQVLARGPVETVIASRGLTTWTVTGDGLAGLRERLLARAGVDRVAPFGTRLHVLGRDADRLEAAIAPFRAEPGLSWSQAAPTLEDAFIDIVEAMPGPQAG